MKGDYRLAMVDVRTLLERLDKLRYSVGAMDGFTLWFGGRGDNRVIAEASKYGGEIDILVCRDHNDMMPIDSVGVAVDFDDFFDLLSDMDGDEVMLILGSDGYLRVDNLSGKIGFSIPAKIKKEEIKNDVDGRP